MNRHRLKSARCLDERSRQGSPDLNGQSWGANHGESGDEPAQETLDTTGLCRQVVHGAPWPPVAVENPLVEPLANRDGVLESDIGMRPLRFRSEFVSCG